MTPRSKRALFVVTSHSRLGDSDRPTGLFLAELVEPYTLLRQRGVEIDVASPLGGAAPVDPCSRATDVEVLASVAGQTIPLATRSESYDLYLVVGGRGALWDLARDADLGRLLAQAFGAGKVIATIGHGAAGLLAVPGEPGESIVHGRRLTASSDREEQDSGWASTLPLSLERQLAEQGARLELAPPWSERVVSDGRLITGQNPASAPGVARTIVQLLAEM
jgi:putative intracellular protease/amidase